MKTATRKTTKTNGKAAKSRTRKPAATAMSKPAKIATVAPKEEWPIPREERERAATLLAQLDEGNSPLDTIWGLVGGPICKNLGLTLAFAEALSDEQFRKMYEDVMFDKLTIKLDRDTRWDLMRELLPALLATEVESAFDSF